MNREAWLTQAVAELTPRLESQGATVPAVRVSVGFPKGAHGRARAIGQCWAPEAVSDKVPAIFISPELHSPVKILGVLLHELVHAATPGAGHRAPFSRLAKAAGLVKPWTATGESPELVADLEDIIARLGAFDHGSINVGAGAKKQTTRMIKLVCPDDGYLVRTTAKWIEVGFPYCPEGHPMEEGV